MGTTLLMVWKRMAEAASEAAADRMILEEGVVVSGEHIILVLKVVIDERVFLEEFLEI